MRHDPAIAAIVIMLRELKMFGMAQAVSEIGRARRTGLRGRAVDALSAAQSGDSRARGAAVAYQLKQAKLPAYRDLAGFDFSNSEAQRSSGASAAPLRVHGQG